MTEATKAKISTALMGNTNCAGKKNALGKTWTLSEATKQRQKEARKRRPLDPNPSYQAVHLWARRHFSRTGTCEACDESRVTYWSNISGDYRRTRDDFWELCVPCHKLFDYILAIDRADSALVTILRERRSKATVNLQLKDVSE